jgi:hypothetical protein
VPIHAQVTAFERRCYALCGTIPRGCVTTYGVLAGALDPPSAARAVGQVRGITLVSLRITPLVSMIVDLDDQLQSYMGDSRLSAVMCK